MKELVWWKVVVMKYLFYSNKFCDVLLKNVEEKKNKKTSKKHRTTRFHNVPGNYYVIVVVEYGGVWTDSTTLT